MAESVQFWLDNKMSAGIQVAEIGELQLVVYRDKYYMVEKGAARMKGGKPLRYSKSSMPLIWKKALRGETPPADTLTPLPDEALPMESITRRVRAKKEKIAPIAAMTDTPALEPEQTPIISKTIKPSLKIAKQAAIKPVPQAIVVANCPYCNHKHELPLEKGKNGKPFFVACTRCGVDFAVRFVTATMYQAQVAGFR